MSGSVTVVGSSINNGLIGLVTVPGSFGTTQSAIQTLLTAVSGSVTQNGVNFENENVAGLSGNQAVTVGGFGTGVFELTNSDSVLGTSTAGSANVSVSVPNAYNFIVVEAPGSETVNSSATGLLAVFGSQSAVDFNGGGNGTVIAAGAGDFVGLDGGTWSVFGSGGDSIQSAAASDTITTAGNGNVVGLLGGSSNVLLGGTGDLIETYNSGVTGSISVSGANDRVLVDGGSNTVTAVTGNSGLNIFFNLSGGSLDFINNSTSSATVSGAVAGAIGGSVTAFGGAGGGTYIGGPGGNNSLIGGTGLVTLLGSGTNNLESVIGAVAAGNVLSVGNSGSSTLIASATTTNNTFFGGATGSSVMQSSGPGTQTFFVGTGDQENLTGSTTAGAVNDYYFLQGTSGSGSDVITNFRLSTDSIFIDTIGSFQGQVSVASIVAHGGSNPGSTIFLSDNTSITLYGVTTAQLAAKGIGQGSTTI
jgi:hypothetical protein